MMQRLRESTKAIMVIVSVAFVGLMVFEWGMDYSGQSSRAGAASNLGSVNGQEISIDEFQRQYRLLYEDAQRRSLDGSLSADELRQIEQRAWEDVVDLALLQREAERRDIRLTDTELIEFIRSNPPPDIVRLPAFQTDGQFDLQKYQNALGDPALSATWAQYEEQVRRNLPLQRLQEQIVAGVTVSDAELLETYRAQNEQARIDYLYLDPDVLVDPGEVAVSEDDVRDRYDAERERYHQAPSAKIRYAVSLPVTTAEDSVAVAQRADSIAAIAKQADTDFATLADETSEDALTRDAGGELGWFLPSSMAPEFAAAVERLEPGEVSDPVLTEFGWHIIKVEDELEQDDGTRVRARHILLPIEPSAEAREAARQAAQAVATEVSQAPETFTSVAESQGLSVSSPPIFEEGVVVPGIGPAPTVSEFVFANDANAVSGAIEHANAFYVVLVEERYPEGYVALEQVADEIRAELVRERQQERVREMVPEIEAAVREGGLRAAADRFSLTVRTTDFFTRLNNIPGVGSGTPVAGAAFGLSQGQVAGPIEADRGLYFIRLLEKRPYDAEAFARERESLTNQIRIAKMRSAFEEWIDNLRATAEIEDNRAQLLGTT